MNNLFPLKKKETKTDLAVKNIYIMNHFLKKVKICEGLSSGQHLEFDF